MPESAHISMQCKFQYQSQYLKPLFVKISGWAFIALTKLK